MLAISYSSRHHMKLQSVIAHRAYPPRRSFLSGMQLALLFILLSAFIASSQVVTFVEYRNLCLFSDSYESHSQAPIQLLRNRYQLYSAIFKTRGWVQSGRHLDFAVIVGIGLEGFASNNTNESAREIACTLGELPVVRMLLLPGPEDYGRPPRFNLYQYERFVDEVKNVLPSKMIFDLTDTNGIQLAGFRLVGLDNGFFLKAAEAGQGMLVKARVDQAAQLIETSDRPVLLFTYFGEPVNESGDSSKWIQAEVVLPS